MAFILRLFVVGIAGDLPVLEPAANDGQNFTRCVFELERL